MKRLNAALLAAVAALAAFFYLRPAPLPVSHALSQLQPPEIRPIRVERPGLPPLRLERRRGAWMITEPFAARADEARVQRLIEIAGARSRDRLAATGLARFELEPPAARLALDGQVFAFGMLNPSVNEQYVLTGGAVYLVHPRYGSALPATAADLASRSLFGRGELPVGIAIPGYAVEQREGRWVPSAGAGEASQDDLARWIELWRMAAATRAEPLEGGKPRQRIDVRLNDGRTLALGVLAREPELVLARADEKMQYYFSAAAGKKLLSPPDAK